MNGEWVVRYVTYNAFKREAYAKTEENAWEIYSGLKILAHVTSIDVPTQPYNNLLQLTGQEPGN